MSEDGRPEDDSFEPPSRLITARLVLRVPEAGDAEGIKALVGNYKVAEMTASIPHPYGLEDALVFIARVREGFAESPTYVLIARGGGRLVGACGYRVSEDGEHPEIGYWIGEPFWGMGYATEAAQAVVDLYFSVTGRKQLSGACRVINRGSRRVLEKCGFQRSGEGMILSRALGGLVPVHRYRLERAIWASLKGWRDVHATEDDGCSPLPV